MFFIACLILSAKSKCKLRINFLAVDLFSFKRMRRKYF